MSSVPHPPVVIGGVGGSGTRLIAQLLAYLGFHLGEELNDASDNLWFSFLFRRSRLLSPHPAAKFELELALSIFRSAMQGGSPLTAVQKRWLTTLHARSDTPERFMGSRDIVNSLIEAADKTRMQWVRWGWKEPNTHVFLERLDETFPELRYVHVIRNGLDMAFSANQNQLRLWGKYFLKPADLDPSPRSALKYWCAVHRRILQIGESMSGRFLLLNFDRFCARPMDGIRVLTSFLEIAPGKARQYELCRMVQPPGSIGRFKAYAPTDFDAEDIGYVDQLGFDMKFS